MLCVQTVGPSVTRLKCVKSDGVSAVAWSLAAHVSEHNALQLITAECDLDFGMVCEHGTAV